MNSILAFLKLASTVFYIRFRRYILPAFLPFRSSYSSIPKPQLSYFPFFGYSEFISIPLCILSNYFSNTFDILGSGWSSYSLSKRHISRFVCSRFFWLNYSDILLSSQKVWPFTLSWSTRQFFQLPVWSGRPSADHAGSSSPS